jgi:hypothetical protein
VAQEEETSLLFAKVDTATLPDPAELGNDDRDQSSGADLHLSPVSGGEHSAEVSAYTGIDVLLQP